MSHHVSTSVRSRRPPWLATHSAVLALSGALPGANIADVYDQAIGISMTTNTTKAARKPRRNRLRPEAT